VVGRLVGWSFGGIWSALARVPCVAIRWSAARYDDAQPASSRLTRLPATRGRDGQTEVDRLAGETLERPTSTPSRDGISLLLAQSQGLFERPACGFWLARYAQDLAEIH
jgi:hypothetical protein